MSDEKKESCTELLYLVVDDNDGARKTVVDFLKSFGMDRIIEASDVEEAWTHLEGHPVDFIISDWEMPGVSGLEFLRTLRKNERWKNVPFIMITAPISHENLKVEQAAMSEVDAYILKPFRAHVLLQKIEEALVECRERERIAALVIDDDDQVRSLMREMLTTMGYSPVLEAADGAQGYEVLTQNAHSIAIVVCDWEMPEKTGLELLQQIRIDRELHSMPFLMVTSQVSMEQLKIQKAIEADVDHYLLKPFVYVEFEKKVKFVAEKAKKARKAAAKLAHAIRAGEDGDEDAAIALYTQTLTLDPKNIDAILGLAHVKIKKFSQSAFDECIQMIKRAIQMDPKLDRSYIALALAFEKGLSLEKGIQTLKDGLKRCPSSPYLFFELARLEFEIGKHNEAFTLIQKAVELKPDYLEAKELQGRIALRLADVKAETAKIED
jgi:two-component system chemotaxis response regulator CheY